MTFFLQLPEMMPPKMSATAMNMKMNHPAFVTFAVLSGIVMLPVLGLASAPLSDAEADLIVEAEMRERAEREADRRAQLRDVPASQEWVVDQAEGKTVFRRVAPPVQESKFVTYPMIIQSFDGSQMGSAVRWAVRWGQGETCYI